MHTFSAFIKSNTFLISSKNCLYMDPIEFHFKQPTTIQVFGPTLCGKTRHVRRILEEELIQPFATRIVWVYSEWQLDYESIRERYPCIEFEHGWRNEWLDSMNPDHRNILILDDHIGVASRWPTSLPEDRIIGIWLLYTWCKMSIIKERAKGQSN